ncbi:MAG: RNA-binding S4 domain-containing protein [Flavobacteriales bacterium]|nr:RNA-binding S4 domain-containing protein [Flavobacteriales bacterium]
MRIDKFLWSVRIYKTRSLATDACKKGRVSINEHVVKPSKETQIKDLISVKKKAISYKYEIISLPKSRVGAKLVEDYVKDLTPASEIEKREMIRLGRPLVSSVKRKFKGRPTKKERRDLEKLRDEEDKDPAI